LNGCFGSFLRIGITALEVGEAVLALFASTGLLPEGILTAVANELIVEAAFKDQRLSLTTAAIAFRHRLPPRGKLCS
jgi:hypothetical protein